MAFGKTHKFSDAWDLQEGQVESIDDPKNSRRVKVRVYDLHGKLDENNGEPTTEELPWARVVMPVTASGGSFTSSSTHNLKVGDFVLVKFSKGDTNKPLVIGCVDAGVACASEKKPESLGKYCKPFEKAVYQDQKNGNNPDPRNHVPQDQCPDGGSKTLGRFGTETASDGLNGLRDEASPANQAGEFKVRRASVDCPESPQGSISNILSEFFATLQHTNGNIGSYYISKYTGGLFELQSVANGYIDRVKAIMDAAMSRIMGEMMNMLRKAVKALMKAILAPLPGILGTATEWFSKMMEKLGCSMMDVSGRIQNFIGGILNGYVGNIMNWSACQVKRFTDSIFGRVLGEVTGVINGLFGGISKVLGAIGSGLNLIGGGLSSIMKMLGLSCSGNNKCAKPKKKDSKGGAFSGLSGGFNTLDELLADLETGNHLPINSYCGDATTDPEPKTEVGIWGPTVPDDGNNGGTTDTGIDDGTTTGGGTTGTGVNYDDIASAICNARFFKVLDIVEADAVTEGDIAQIRITRTGDTSSTSSITYRTQDGTAKAGQDYCAVNGFIGFGIGETEKIIEVKTIDNGVKDGNKYFFLKMQGDGCGQIPKDVGRIWMKDPTAITTVPVLTDPDVTTDGTSSTQLLNLTNPVYHLTTDTEVVYEGEEVTFKLTTQNVDDDTQVNYTLGRESTGITFNDLEYVIENGEKTWINRVEDLSRSFTVVDGKAEVTVKVYDDGVVEDTNNVAEQLYLELNNLSTSKGVAVLDAREAVVDPSVRSVKVTPNKSVVEEGESVVYTIVTTNFDQGEMLPYTIFGTNITENDVEEPLTGNLYIENNSAKFTLNISKDGEIEDAENLIFSIDDYGSQATVVISVPAETPAEGETDPVIDEDEPEFDDPIIDEETGGIVDIEVKRSGRRYIAKPFITLESNVGYGAYVEPILNSQGYLSRVRVVTPGYGYTGKTKPSNTVCQLVNIVLTNVGGFFTSPPTILVNGISGIARATISDEGFVNGIVMIKKDMQYVSQPEIEIYGGNGFGARAIADLQCVPAEESELILQGLARDPANYVDCP